MCIVSHRRRSVKKLFLKISQYSPQNTCVGDSFLKFGILRNFLQDLFWRTSTNCCFWKYSTNWEKITFAESGIIHSTLEAALNGYLFIFVSWLVSFRVCIYLQYFFDGVRNIYKRVRKKKIKSLRKEYVITTSFKFWQMKNFFRQLSKPTRVWFWLVYHFTESYCRFPSSIKLKISILTLKLLLISS